MPSGFVPSNHALHNDQFVDHYSDLSHAFGQEHDHDSGLPRDTGAALPTQILKDAASGAKEHRGSRRSSRHSVFSERDARSCYSDRVNRLRRALYWVIEEPDANHGSLKTASRATAALSLSMILLSLVCFVFETMPVFADTSDTVWKAVEVITTLAFTMEYMLRLWVCDVFGTSMISWLIRPMNVCDLLAISPMYIELVFKSDNIQGLRVLRVMRLFKLGRYSQGVQVMSAALTNSLSALYILIFLFFIGVVIFASAVYFTEKLSCPYFEDGGDKGMDQFLQYGQECTASDDGVSKTFGTCCAYMCRGVSSNISARVPCDYNWRHSSGLKLGGKKETIPPAWEVSAVHEIQFTSVLTTMWWACVTMTTVGYGDYVPNNWLSKLVSSVAMLSGMLIIAMPFAIVGTKFGEAVAIYEDPDVKPGAAHRKALENALKNSSGDSGGPDRKHDSLSLERLAAVQNDLRKSVQLKQQIIKLQILRDNLWTSVEHAMAEITYEGIMHFEDDLLVADDDSDIVSDISMSPSEMGRVSMFGDDKVARVFLEDDGTVLCRRSLGIFHRRNPIRRWAIWLCRDWGWFDRIVLVLIILNSIILALHDYYPRDHKPWENELDDKTEIAFIILFTLEFLVKVVAFGFIMESNTYLHDLWNWLDFLVVVTGLITLAMGSEDNNLSFLRTVRVLRPLRTLSAMPGMRVLVNTVFLSLHRLMQDVVIMAFFLLTVFGILGLHFWGGVLHRLCRVTPQPLHFVQNALDPGCNGWCFDDHSMVQIGGKSINSTVVFNAFCKKPGMVSQCEEAINGGKDFYTWPVDTTPGRFCGGAYKCEPSDGAGWGFGVDSAFIKSEVLLPLGMARDKNGKIETLCGNDFTSDEKYGPQLISSAYDPKEVDAMSDWTEQVRKEEFNWGITRYDQIGSAMLVIFQSVTLEGWVDIMYMLQDASSPSFFAFLYFLVLLLLGAFFLVNITLAIVWDEFYKMTSVEKAQITDVKEFKEDDGDVSITASEGIRIAMEENPTAVLMGKNDYKDVRDLPGVKRSTTQKFLKGLSNFVGFRSSLVFVESSTNKIRQTVFSRSATTPEQLLLEPHPLMMINLARRVARSSVFNTFVMSVIAANVVVLAVNAYREPIIPEEIGETLNLVFNCIFIMELVTLHIALNPVNYWREAALAFDGVIVVLSVVDMAIKEASAGQGGGSGVTAIRAFRLLRVFKLAKRFRQLKNLMKAVLETLTSIRDYVFLLCIIVIVFALIGQSFFAGKFMFDPDTGEPITVDPEKCPFGPGDKPKCVPRAHFDSFLWGCTTIFQILTGENWNVIMYDGIKAAGWGFIVYFVMVVVFGNFVILNLFLAILMMNFEMARERMREQQREREEERARMKQLIEERRAETLQAIGPNVQQATDQMLVSPRRQYDGVMKPSQSMFMDDGIVMTASRSMKSFARRTTDAMKKVISAGRQTMVGEDSVDAQMRRENSVDQRAIEQKRSEASSAEEQRRQTMGVAPSDTWAKQNRVAPETNPSKEANDLKVENVSDTSNDQKHKSAPSRDSRDRLDSYVGVDALSRCADSARVVAFSDAVESDINYQERPRQDGAYEQSAQRTGTDSRTRQGFHEMQALQRPDTNPHADVTRLDRINTSAKIFLAALAPHTHSIKHHDSDDDARMTRNLTTMKSRPSAMTNSFSGGDSIWERSLFIFNDREPFRNSCIRLIRHPWFDRIVITLITLSSALMMFSNPLHDPGGTVEMTLQWVNVAFTVIFTGEMLIKIIALGLIFDNPTIGRKAYLRTTWNIADAVIVTVSVVDTVQTFVAKDSSGAVSFMKVFRIARILRPLRLISRNENLKVVVRTIYASIPELRNMLLFTSIIFMIWGMLGVSYFKGAFYSCLDSKLESVSFKESPTGWTHLCIPNVSATANAVNASDMLFVQQMSPSECLESGDMFSWHRPTRATPICEVNCQGSSHPFCMNNKPWGYHVMRCQHCQATFCPNPKADEESCRTRCKGHRIFCLDDDNLNKPKDQACLDECVAECMCPDHCNALSDDAALCVEQGGRWINTDQHFNNLLDGWVSLFEISTTEGWVDLMYMAADSRGAMKQPKRDSNQIVGILLFVSFILVGTFFVLNLCVGVIINNYHEQILHTGQLDITESQKRWVCWQKALYSRKNFFPQTNLNLLSPTRQHMTSIVSSSWFDNSIMACILLNTVVLGMQWYPVPPEPYLDVLDGANLFFALVFNGEAAMKLLAMHSNYFKESWNIFDFFCVVVSDVFLVFEATSVGSQESDSQKGGMSVEVGTAVNTIRIFRIARLFRLVRFLKGLNQLFYAFVLSLPKLCNVCIMLGLLIFLYAVMGLNLFAKVGYLGKAHNEQANFRTFWGAVSVLVRSMTGEGWNFIMHDLSKTRFYYETYMDIQCDETFSITADNFDGLDLDGDGVVDNPTECGSPYAYVYFITYTLLVTFVVFNLFIAVILDGYDESQQSEVNDIIETCIEVWRKYDPECLMVLPLERALDYIDEVVDTLCKEDAIGEAVPWYTMNRWDEQYTGEIAKGVHSWSYYNLQYMRVLNLRIIDSPGFDVRFIVVLKAAIRRLVIQGGLRYQGHSNDQRRMHLIELEELDGLSQVEFHYEALKAELERLRQLERKQQRILLLTAPQLHGAVDEVASLLRLSSRTSRTSAGPRSRLDERFLPEEVAAAKIQRRIKELLQRRRARAASSLSGDDDDGRINRAAG